MTAQPKNYLKTILAARQAQERAAEIMNQQPQAVVDGSRTLREVKTRDQSGRVITEFEGSPSAWLNDFAAEPRRLVKINTR